MASSRFIKTPKLSIVLQLTEAPSSGGDDRTWEVHDIERNRGFRVTLSHRSLEQAAPAAGRARRFTDDEIDAALGLAIERALVTPPEKVAGTLYDVPIAHDDLRDAAQLGPRGA